MSIDEELEELKTVKPILDDLDISYEDYLKEDLDDEYFKDDNSYIIDLS